MSVIEQLLLSTVRIECADASGAVSSGTGFHFRFALDDFWVPVIITNKHVLQGARQCRFYLSTLTAEGVPSGLHVPIVFTDFHNAGWMEHPDPGVDLAVLFIQPLLAELTDRHNISVRYIDLNTSVIPTTDTLGKLLPLEDITMIGYPNGLWDSVNNRPIVRRGVTATACNVHYRGRTEFLIDAAVFPGSSGSPVFIFNQGPYSEPGGSINFGTRLILIGILYAVHLHTAEGELVTIEAPTRADQISLSRIPNNLGICIQSRRILEFEGLIRGRAAAGRSTL